MSFAKGPFRCLTDDGKGFRKDLLYGFPSLNPLFKFRGLGPELIITQWTDFRLHLVDFIDEGLNPSQLPFVLTPYYLLDQ